MSTRGRRARGRPPKTPLSSNRPRTSINFLRKPKALQNKDESNNSSRCSTPISIPGTPTRKNNRFGTRESTGRGRTFISRVAYDDEVDEASRSSMVSEDGVIDDFETKSDLSDDSFEDSDSDFSDSSLSTVASSVGRRHFFIRRPVSPDIDDESEIPPLILPSSSNDLTIPNDYLMQCLSIYEVLRHYRTILRLSPFSFEDFCAALLSEELCILLTEIHITLLRSLIREEDGNNTTFGAQDTKDSVNIALFHIDSFTWSELIRSFLESDRHCTDSDYEEAIKSLEIPDYPFVQLPERIKVLKILTDLFLGSNSVREEILNEGNIQYDDHCRACHKLGDLLCCETCSAVYHLTCVEPALEEVPDEDWVCSICKAHKIQGVTDCISEAEKIGLLCRQEPIGYDRHRRKYWFLIRRIIVEGENDVWYYSTKYQIDELLEVLDKNKYERDLVMFINEMRDEMVRQMMITEELTNASKGTRKSAIDMEIANLTKVQSERVIQKEQEEKDRKAKEEEDKRKAEEEKKKAEEQIEIEKQNQEEKVESMEVAEEVSVTTTTTAASNSFTSEAEIDDQTKVSIEKTEVSQTTTTTSVKTVTSSTTVISTSSSDTKSDSATSSNGAKIIKITPEMSVEIFKNATANSSGKESDTAEKSESTGDKKEESKTIMNVQSLIPNVKSTLLKVQDDSSTPQKQTIKPTIFKVQDDSGSAQKQTRTVLIVNRDGNKVTLAVSKQPITAGDQNTPTTAMSLSQSISNALTSVTSSESRKIITRSKTGSLTPKTFTDSVTSTTTSKSISKSGSDDLLVINKDGDITRITRSKSSVWSLQSHQYFKLGMECSFKNYSNQYSTNTLALNKHQHNEERDKKRFLSHKFSLTPISEFKWGGSCNGRKTVVLQTLVTTITNLESNLPSALLHPNWPLHRQSWANAVQLCRTPSDFGLALSILESCMKPVIFNPVWTEALGHSKLMKITATDREELKKKEKEIRKRKEEEEDARPLVWIKYTLGLKHQVWKQKGEEYRVTGGQGWCWRSKTRSYKYVPQETVGLRSVAKKLQARKRKSEKDGESVSNTDDQSVSVKTEVKKEEVEVKTEVKEENMEVDKEKTEIVVKSESLKAESPDSQEIKTEIKTELPSVVESQDSEISCVENSGNDSSEMCNTEEQKVEMMECDTGEGNQVKEEIDLDIKSSPIKNEKDIDIESNSPVKKLDVESGSPVKKSELDVILVAPKKHRSEFNLVKKMEVETVEENDEKKVISVGNKNHTVTINVAASKLRPPILHIDTLDVSKALNERSFYDKITKPYAKLDMLLAKRIKQDEIETKQRQALQQQINWKLKVELSPGAKDDESEAENKEKTDTDESDHDISLHHDESSPYTCYSYLCRGQGKSMCYSPLCIHNRSLEEELTTGLEDSTHKMEEDEDGGKDGNKNEDKMDVDVISTEDGKTEVKMEVEVGEEKTNLNTNGEKKDVPSESKAVKPSVDSKKEDVKQKTGVNSSIPPLLQNKKNQFFTGAQLALKQAIEKMSIDELRTKMPPVRSTKHEIKLIKYSRFGQKVNKKKANLPQCHKYLTPSGKKTMFALEKHDLKKLARKAGKTETKAFNYNCKMNNVNWIYPCPRPIFKTAWKYRTQTVKTFGSVALQLRIMYVCLRWDDISIKPPVGGTNTVSTESEITTTELLKRRDVGPHMLRSEFLVRKIVVPLGITSQPKEKYTPQRSGLRERKKAESPKHTEPSVTEVWTPEEELEIWEIKQFGEKLAKQRAALTEKVNIEQANQTAVNAAQLKATLEVQLKQQRLALQQKRLLEAQGKTGDSVSTTQSIITATLSSSGGGTIIKTIGTTTTGSLIGTGPTSILKNVQVQPKSLLSPSVTSAISSTTPNQLVKVQLPKTTIQIQPTTRLALAPKPGMVATTNTTSTMPTRIVIPGNTATAATSAPKLAVNTVRPANANPSNPGGQVQNLQIIQGPSGQLQVRGLLPGQQIIRLPDGRLQLLTMPNQQATQATTQASAVPQVAVQKPTSILVNSQSSTPLPTAAGSTPQLVITSNQQTLTSPSRVLIPSQLQSNVAGAGGVVLAKPMTVGTAATQLRQPGQVTIVSQAATPGQIGLTGSPMKTITVARPATASASIAKIGGQPVIISQSGGSSALSVASASSLTNAASSAIRQVIMTTPQNTPVKVSPAPGTVINANTAAALLQARQLQIRQQQVLQQVQPQQVVQTTAQQNVTSLLAQQPRPALPVSAAGNTKYAVTPQVVQQVVRQALMQNQTPEIQAKLLAMQRSMVTKPPTPTITTISQPMDDDMDEDSMSSFDSSVEEYKPKVGKQLEVSKDSREDQMRKMVCNQAIRSIVDKIERKEKEAMRKVKKQELEDEKHKKMLAAKLQQALFKHKEIVKKDILKKRALMEKNLQQDIQLEVAAELKKRPVQQQIPIKQQKVSHGIPQQQTIQTPTQDVPPLQPPPSKRKKQKIISTGGGRALNPKEKLYCVCRTPYDDTKFYIGCDLCSNWFHGGCVGISEGKAKTVDSYTCPDCKRQQETTTEELYCLCKTPYDESQFYIGCDRCQDWFHGKCVGISEKEAGSLDVYLCPKCKQQDKEDPISSKILTDSDYEQLKRLVKSLQSHKMAWPFLEPVDPNEVPDYYTVIKDPMDLTTVERRIQNRHYVKLIEFIKDITKIFDNCRLYNTPDTPFYQCAEVLDTFFGQRIKALKGRLGSK
ncbi:nucleosome-remodeling factor subunit BPTF [Mytilus galloprovincialis]|uniref:Nucleosome-remodeling factor subunit BPTF n=2 Tax=Mytilus TaxID=6548 RepID=A0A8B6F1Q7_MYTGA|nr:nucleosome-remodeling factor subunit BPTF [Mytilus galloprovincialis]